jgi:hypothetical protein
MTLHYDGSLRWQSHNFEGIAALSSSLPFLKVESIGEWPAVERVSLQRPDRTGDVRPRRPGDAAPAWTCPGHRR